MLAVSLLLQSLTGPSLASLDQLAQARDVAGLSRFVTGLPSVNPLDVLKTGGAYAVGKFGWHALSLEGFSSAASYVVLSTPLTSEDIGEFLFRRERNSLKLIPEDDGLGVKILRHDFDVRYDLPKKQVSIVDELSLRSTGSGEFVFRMSPCYRVASIVSADGRAIPFRQAGGVVILRKPVALEAKYTVRYGGVVDLPEYAGSISTKEATLVNDYWYPMVARGPAPYSITMHCPKNWLNVGQGVVERDELTSTERVTHYRMDLPVVYFSASSGPYRRAEAHADGRTFYAWSPRMTDEALHVEAETYIPIIRFYENFGAFPFKSYGALDSPTYGGGALEAYSYATYGGGLPVVDAHEPSHTWWGGIIDNTYLHSFWNESFAVFSDGLYHRDGPGGNREEKRLAFIRSPEPGPDYERAACSKSGADRGPIGSSLGYGKGSQVLQMLEQLMGTPSMIAAMHRWVADQPRGKPGEWEDFEHAAERERPDLHLESFFADWLDRPGHVDFNAQVGYSDGSVKIGLTYSGLPFRIPLEVLLQFPDGSKSLKTFDVSQNGSIEFPSEKRPSIVSLDPYRRLIRPIVGDEAPVDLGSALQGAPRVVDQSRKEWSATFGGEVGPAPADLNGVCLIGSPETMPAMVPLCAKVGFKVSGDSLTYDGTTIDLNHGAAMAVVDLGNGKRCVIALGRTRLRPETGRARLGLFDNFGRMLRGKTDPKLSGHLTYRL